MRDNSSVATKQAVYSYLSYRALIRIHKKKLQHIAFGCSEDLRAKFIADIAIYDPHVLMGR